MQQDFCNDTLEVFTRYAVGTRMHDKDVCGQEVMGVTYEREVRKGYV